MFRGYGFGSSSDDDGYGLRLGSSGHFGSGLTTRSGTGGTSTTYSPSGDMTTTTCYGDSLGGFHAYSYTTGPGGFSTTSTTGRYTGDRDFGQFTAYGTTIGPGGVTTHDITGHKSPFGMMGTTYSYGPDGFSMHDWS
jgi:hypothetical protein